MKKLLAIAIFSIAALSISTPAQAFFFGLWGSNRCCWNSGYSYGYGYGAYNYGNCCPGYYGGFYY